MPITGKVPTQVGFRMGLVIWNYSCGKAGGRGRKVKKMVFSEKINFLELAGSPGAMVLVPGGCPLQARYLPIRAFEFAWYFGNVTVGRPVAGAGK